MRKLSAPTNYKIWLTTAGLFAVLGAPLAVAIDVSVETTDCEGATGFASFDSTRLAKIQDAVCRDPNDPSKRLQQVLIKSDSTLTQFDVLTVTNEASKEIIAQVRGIIDAEKKNLTRPDVVIEQKEITQVVQPRASSTRGSVSTTQVGSTRPPTIEISDPPVTGVRSLTNVITEPGLTHRQIVGRVKSAHSVVSLTVNGRTLTLAPNGLFQTPVSLTSERTPVSIVAVDDQGQSSSVDFHLVRRSPAPAPPGPGEEDSFGNYHALVIANNTYTQLDDLITPLNDGEAIASILQQDYGFTVTKLFNATRYDMLTALNNMRRDLNENDNLMIYFAGHGAFDNANKRGHWLPVDAEHDSTANWVSTIDITDIVNAMSARHILVVADSCYSGALTRAENTELDPGMSDELRAKWLRTVAKTRSRHLLTSGGVKPVVDDAGNGHSVFANAFIEVLAAGSGILESSVLYRRVKELVAVRAEELDLEQTPHYAELKRTGHEFGEFLLVVRD